MVSKWRSGVVAVILAILGEISQVTTTNAQDPSATLEDLKSQLLELDRQKKYADAIPLAEQYVALTRASLGEEHPRHVNAVGVLALLYQSQHRYSEAELLFKRALALDEKMHGLEHPDVAADLDELASLYVEQKRYSDAETLYKRALSITERMRGPDHADVATALNKLAGLHRAQNRPRESEPLLKRALSIQEKALGADHASVGSTLEALAKLYDSQGRRGEVEPLLKRALAIKETVLGVDHPDLRNLLNDLAFRSRMDDRYAEAEQLYRRVVAITEKALGPDHPKVAAALNELAFLYQMQSHYADAEPLYRRALAVMEKALGPDHPELRTWLDRLAYLYEAQRNYTEAEPIYKRALAIMERALGPDHPAVHDSLDKLAELYRQQRKYAEAEPLLKRSLAIKENEVGPNDPSVRFPLNGLGLLYTSQGRYAEAEPVYKRALALTEAVSTGELGRALSNLIQVYKALVRYGEAEPLMRRALAIAEERYAPDRPDVVNDLALHYALNNLGRLLQETNRLAEAETLYRRALASDEKRWGLIEEHVFIDLDNLGGLLNETNRLAEAEALHRRALAMAEGYGPGQAVSTALNNLATLLKDTDRWAEAEMLYRRALPLAESFGYPPLIASLLSNLAVVMRDTNRLAEAEQLVRRALAIFEKSFGPDHPEVAVPLNNLANLLHDTNRSAEAELLFRRALAIEEKSFGPDHPKVAVRLNNLAELLYDTGRLAEADPLVRRALAIKEKSYGPDHPTVASSLSTLALLYKNTNRLAEAEQLVRRALAISEKSYGPDHSRVAADLSNLAVLRAQSGDWGEAAALYARAKPIWIARGRDAATTDRDGLTKAVLAQNTEQFRRHALALHHAEPQSGAALAQGFELAQWALLTDAAEALAQMSTRFARGEGPLVDLVRQRQNLVARRRAEDKRLIAAVGTNAPTLAALRASIAELDDGLKRIDAELAKTFPEYAELANPKPLTAADTQALLRPDEALVLFLDVRQLGQLPEETLVWVVTKETVGWRSIPLGTRSLTERVTALRCGLDNTLWYAGESADRCKDLLRASPSQEEVNGQRVRVLPFELTRAHELYRALFGSVENMIRGKVLLIVPSGPLTSLPFNVLVTEPLKPSIPAKLADYRHAAWLGTRQPMSVLPSVASLKALRRFAKTSHATKPYLGVGNPLLDGQQDDPQFGAFYEKQARAARDKQQCSKPISRHIALASARHLADISRLFRGAHADIEQLRQLNPLPETADELCEVGRRLGVPESDVLLGNRATEAMLKDLSENGRLADYRVLHFATHGALTGEVRGSAEPGLILTPPEGGASDAQALERDDGFLAASEIAALKLDADWVILSACNTAGGSGESAEALSGLARAFFYAGARALLVSHWEVGSDAAVKLTTQAFAELNANPRSGRAEAMRLSMRHLINNGSLDETHPAQWAPFVLVGESGTEDFAPEPHTTFPVIPALSAKLPTNAKRARAPKREAAPEWRREVWQK